MGQITVGYLMLAGLLVWTVLALQSGNVPSSMWLWFKKPKNAAKALRWAVWAAALVFAGATWIAKPGSELADFRTEATGIAIAVVVIEEVSRWRTYLEYKQTIIQQMASQSNDFALDAVRLARDEGWLRDGSLRGAFFVQANLEGANLNGADFQDCYLVGANLGRADLWSANLQGAKLAGANLKNTAFDGANLQGAFLKFAKYNGQTKWPVGFTPPPDAINVDEQPSQA